MKTFKLMLAILVSSVVAGCGGGGGGGGSTTVNTTPTPSALRLGGVVAAGAPVVGSVIAKDSTGKVYGPTTINADGSYSLTVTGGTAPFILQASGSVGDMAVEVYSTAPDTTATNVNITPLTNVMVAQATGASPATLYSSCSSTSCAAPNKAKVDLAVQQVQALLQALLDKFGITGTVNVLTDALVAGPVTGQSAIDKLLDVVSIQPASVGSADFVVKPNPVTGLDITTTLVTITAPATGGVTAVATTPLVVDSSLTTIVVNTATTSLTSLQGIQAQFDVMTGLYATARPAAGNTTLLALFDPAWLNFGDNKTTQTSNMTNTTYGPPAGTKWASVVATEKRASSSVVNDATHQWFKGTMKMPSGNTEVLGPILATNISGTWVMSGNQLAAPNMSVGTYNFANSKTVNYRTVIDSATLSGGSLSLTKTVAPTTGNTITFSATGLAITPTMPNGTEASFTGLMSISDTVTTVSTTVSGTLLVREDESIQMNWIAVNTLSTPNNEVYGCSTTNGQGCKPVNAGIVGTWKMSQYEDGTAASIQMVLLDDSRFMFLSTNTGGCQQMESGKYKYSPETSLLTLSVEYDTSASCGVLQTGSPTFAAPVTIYRTFTPAGVLSSVAGGVTGSFTKQAALTSEVGTWLFDASSGGQFALLINYATGMYVYAEAPSYAFPDPVVSGRGMEYGSYTATVSTYTFGTPTYDGNGVTSGVDGAANSVLPMTAADVNHVSLTVPGPVVLTSARQ